MIKKQTPKAREEVSTGRKRARLSIASAVQRAEAEVGEGGSRDPYLQSAAVAIRALRLLLPDEDLDEENLEFGVSFAWPNVPSPTKLVRTFMEEREAIADLATAVTAAPPAPAVVEPFVYGVIYHELFVVPRTVAEEWARFNRALEGCETWGELKKGAPPELYKDALEVLGHKRIAADRAIDHEALAEEGFPPLLGRIMRWYLPTSLEGRVLVQYSAVGEELPFISEDDLPQVLEVFTSLGVPCTEDLSLIAAAAGYDSVPS